MHFNNTGIPLDNNLQESSCQYWPVEGQVTQFGEFKVDLINQEELSGITVRTLDILQNKVRTRSCQS